MKVYVYYCYEDIEHYEILFNPCSLNYNIVNNDGKVK